MNFSGANLFQSCLTEASLVGADLQNANVSQSHLDRVDLRNATLVQMRSVLATWIGANLSQADARGAGFDDSDLSNADLSECNLQYATFLYSNLGGASLRGADLSGAYLVFASLRGVKDWEKIKSIKCANIFGADAPPGFRSWALSRGAMEIDWNDYQVWLNARDRCMAEVKSSEEVR
ncbi:MAG: pentapeptide repeat-containing protein [Candidatus Hydrogenedentes bacterium]|nr:pentapeptide repeat-containing protein [Candidatus Hydrogenedentota bacterium]